MPETSNWNISIKTWRWDNKSTETSLDEKKVIYEKNNCLIDPILLIIISLLLVVISISQYY